MNKARFLSTIPAALLALAASQANASEVVLGYGSAFEAGGFAASAPRIGLPDRDGEPSPEDQAEADAPKLEYALGVALVTDFRRGGISSSNGKPALQVGFSAEHSSGFAASIWGSNFASDGGSDVEIDAALSYGFAVGSINAELGLTGYFFPGVRDSSYVELQGKIGRTFGNLDLAAVLAYTPAQANTGRQDNIYAGLEFELPLKKTPLTFAGAIGIEDGAFGDKKVDWLLGAAYDLRLFKLGVDYVDATRTSGAPHSDATLVFSASKEF